MEVKCRCHGLSGSCSLKTCWLALPDFRHIGAYLKRKYDVAVHLPSLVSVNKLIPMMDRQEISNILSASATGQPLEPTRQREEFAPRASSSPSEQVPAEPGESAPPMSQQQFQALVRELRLCGASSPSANTSLAYLTRRDSLALQQRSVRSKAQQAHSNGPGGGGGASASRHQVHHQLQQLLHNTSSRDELIHLHASPDYCQAEARQLGFAGVQARICNGTSAQARDSCDRLCCGRGFERREYTLDERCDCQFRYCCSVRCAYCPRKVEVYVCK